MEKILHQLIWFISNNLQGFINVGWCRISSNSIPIPFPAFFETMIFLFRMCWPLFFWQNPGSSQCFLRDFVLATLVAHQNFGWAWIWMDVPPLMIFVYISVENLDVEDIFVQIVIWNILRGSHLAANVAPNIWFIVTWQQNALQATKPVVSNSFLCSPRSLGKGSNLINIVQLGWFNRQLETCSRF